MKRIFSIAACTLALAACSESPKAPEAADISEVREYISGSWDRTIRYNPEDDGTLIGLPCRYTVPSPQGMFQEMYYWDTYFTNEGLLHDGQTNLAKGNVENILSLVDRYGFMPNGSRTWYLNRSQPAFLGLMVDAIWQRTGDIVWIGRAYDTMVREHDFWMEQRSTPCGLNRYAGTGSSKEFIDEVVITGGKRLGKDFNALGLTEEEHDKLGRDFTAECESGWDMNPRFDRRCGDFCPVDLNSLLYADEMILARYAGILGKGSEEVQKWQAAAEKRKELMTKYMFDPQKKQFFDYDYVNDCRSEVVSAAAFYPLFTGLATPKQAKGVVRNGLKALEFNYGISCCEDKPYEYVYQWSFPNTWPPVVYTAMAGLDRYGYRKDARRIAAKYCQLIIDSYRATGTLWEKYDVVDGVMSKGSEYDTPEMFGWSAGTYICASDYLNGIAF